jgi:serine/threonine protein kinase
MYLSKEDIFWKEREQNLRRNDLRRLFNQLQTQRKRAPQSELRRKPLMAGGELPQEIQCKVMNVDVTITHELQHGAFSEGVYKAHTNRLPPRDVALKRVGTSRGAQTAYRNEKRFLEQLNNDEIDGIIGHRNIIQLLGFDDNNRLCFPPASSSFLVLQYANRGDLFDLDPVQDTPNMRWEYAKQIVGAIAYAHSRGVAHGDIKLENILRHRRTYEDGRVDDIIWVTDWGGATDQETEERVLGTIGYISVNMCLKVYSRSGFNNSRLYNLDRWNEEKNNMKQSYCPKKEDIFTLANTLWILLVCAKYILHPESRNFWARVDKIRNDALGLGFIQVCNQTCPEMVFTTTPERKKRIRRCLKRCFLEDETTRLDIHQVNSILFDVPTPQNSTNTSRKRKKEEQRSDGGAKRTNIGLRIRAPTNNNM